MRHSLLLWAAASAVGATALGGSVVLESLPGVPAGWTRLGDAPADRLIKLKIALEQPNLDLFEQTLYAVSDPQHALYGQHLKRDEVKDLLRPRQESTAAVLAWLRAAGVPDSMVEDDGDWINFKVTAGRASRMLNTTLAVYGHDHARVIRTLQYSVPADVAAHVTMIAPLIRFGQPRRQRSHIFEKIDEGLAASTVQAASIPPPVLNATVCNSTSSPECLRALYNIGSYQAVPTERSLLGIAGYLEVCRPARPLFWPASCETDSLFRNMRGGTSLPCSRTSTLPTPRTSTSPSSRSTAA